MTGADAGRPYPVHLTGILDARPSRWLWCIKWLLVLPHLLVLVFLWPAQLIMTVIAGVAILIAGRYPRAIFEFSVGVLRWTWRVTFYAFAPVGTDRYPPFSLAADPDYPADLRVDPPDRLSRGLVLIKWWLLILPQLLVVTVMTGGWGPMRVGLASLLTLIALLGHLFTGQYSSTLFDLIMGLQRWCYRVTAYGLLLTDDYPPFRLDQGAADGPVSVRPETQPAPQPTPQQPAASWTAAR